ncbi:MAG: hypothetical protein AAB558_03395 [Patescibacteria group bacterium]
MPASTLIDFLPGVGKRTTQILHQMGIHTVGQLAHIPEGVLEHIFGPSIQAVMAQARRKHFPASPTNFSMRTEGLHVPAGGDHLSWWKKFQLAARVVSVL